MVPGDAAMGVWGVRIGGEVTGVKGGIDLEESCAGREMESSSSSIAEVMVSGLMWSAVLLYFSHSKELGDVGRHEQTASGKRDVCLAHRTCIIQRWKRQCGEVVNLDHQVGHDTEQSLHCGVGCLVYWFCARSESGPCRVYIAFLTVDAF